MIEIITEDKPSEIFMPDLLTEEQEIWQKRKPKYADHIRVNRGLYFHHGIYVTDKEIIHFTGKDDDDILGTNNEVITSDLKFFAKDVSIEVKIYNNDEISDLYPPIDIVNYARACLGDKGYNLVFNNCEHFANMCTLGRFRSRQIENILKPKGGNVMNLLGSVGSWLGNLFGGNKSRETITTIYEPDKVRVAEIEAQAKMMLAKAEIESTKQKHNLQKELLTHFVEVEKLIMHARKENFLNLAQEIQRLGQTVAENHIQNIENSNNLSADQTKKIADLYHDFEMKQDELITNRLKLVDQVKDKLQELKEDDPSRKIYEKNLDQLFTQIVKQQNDGIISLNAEREMQIKSNIQSKEALQQMLSDNQAQISQIISKSQDLIGVSNTAQLLSQETKNQSLIENNQDIQETEEIINEN